MPFFGSTLFVSYGRTSSIRSCAIKDCGRPLHCGHCVPGGRSGMPPSFDAPTLRRNSSTAVVESRMEDFDTRSRSFVRRASPVETNAARTLLLSINQPPYVFAQLVDLDD